MSINKEYEQLNKRFAFLTYGQYVDQDYLGIIQNSDSAFISMYVYNRIQTDHLKKLFLELGETWWWESNRKIPINMFLGEPFKIFKDYLLTFNFKEFKHILGPNVCLDDMMQKRVKRRTVQLVKRLD